MIFSCSSCLKFQKVVSFPQEPLQHLQIQKQLQLVRIWRTVQLYRRQHINKIGIQFKLYKEYRVLVPSQVTQ